MAYYDPVFEARRKAIDQGKTISSSSVVSGNGFSDPVFEKNRQTIDLQNAKITKKSTKVSVTPTPTPSQNIFQKAGTFISGIMQPPKPTVSPLPSPTIKPGQKLKPAISPLSLGTSQEVSSSMMVTPKVQQEAQQKVAPTVSKATEKIMALDNSRKWMEKEIGRISFVGPRPAYAPESEENAKQLIKDYEDTLSYKANVKAGIFVGSLFKGLTGGALKPEYKLPSTIDEKIIAGIGNTMGTVVALNKIGKVFEGFLMGSGTIGQFITRYPKFSKIVIPFIKTAGTFNIYGQLDKDIENRFYRILEDTAVAIPFSMIGAIKPMKFSIPASVSLGVGLTKLAGGTWEEAIINGAILGTLDAMGRLNARGNINRQVSNKILRTQAIDTLSEYSGIKLTYKSSLEEINKAYRQASKIYHPDVGGNPKDFIAISSAYDYLTGKNENFNYEKTTREQPVKQEKKALQLTAEQQQKEISNLKERLSNAIAKSEEDIVNLKETMPEKVNAFPTKPENATIETNVEVPVSQINFGREDISQKRLLRVSQATGELKAPISAVYDPETGEYTIIEDGNHRLANAILKGKETLKINTVYKPPEKAIKKEELKPVKEPAKEEIKEVKKLTPEYIEPSVVQIVNTVTNKTEYKVIPKGQLEEYKKLIDDTQTGIAGKNINGKVYHLTAKTPEQMNQAKAIYTGIVKKSDIPQAKGLQQIERVLDKNSKLFTDLLEGKGIKDIKNLTSEEIKVRDEFLNYTNRPEVIKKYEEGAKDKEIIRDFLKWKKVERVLGKQITKPPKAITAPPTKTVSEKKAPVPTKPAKEERNLMERENIDLTLPQLKEKLSIAIEGNEDPYLIDLIRKDIQNRQYEVLDFDALMQKKWIKSEIFNNDVSDDEEFKKYLMEEGGIPSEVADYAVDLRTLRFSSGAFTDEQLAEALKKKRLPPPPKMLKPAKTKMTPDKVYSLISKKKATIPVLNTARVKDGLMTFTNLDVWVTMPTDLKDGLYEMVGKDFVKSQIAPEEYPVIPQKPTTEVGKILAENLGDVLKKAFLSSATPDSNRPVIEAVRLQIDQGLLKVTSTDGYRLYYNEIGMKPIKDTDILLTAPGKVSSLINLLTESAVSIKENKELVSFSNENAEIIVRKTEGEYPSIQRVFPSFTRRIVVDRKAFLEAVKSTLPYTKESFHLLRMELGDKELTIKGRLPPDKGGGEKVIPLEIKTSEKENTPEGQLMKGTIVMPVNMKFVEETPEKPNVYGTNNNYVIDVANQFTGDDLYIDFTKDNLKPIHYSDKPEDSIPVFEKPKPPEERTIEDEIKKTPEREARSGYTMSTSKGYPVLTGNPPIIEEGMYGLKVGDKVTQIGEPGRSGKETSSHRVDEFTKPIIYEGTITNLPDLEGKQIVFKYTENGEIYHLLYTTGTDGYIFKPNFDRNVADQYSAKFKKKIEEFNVGDVLDPQGNTNMEGIITIREIEGNTLKFTDSAGKDYSDMQKSIVRKLIDEGSWKRITSGVNINALKDEGSFKILRINTKTMKPLGKELVSTENVADISYTNEELKIARQSPQKFIEITKQKLKEMNLLPAGGGGGVTSAEMSAYADLENMTKRTNNLKVVEFPELLRLVKNLMEGVPSVVRPHYRPMFGGYPLGLFTGIDKGQIKLNPEIFKDPEQAVRVFAHEVGHLNDWLPEQTMKRGNLIGRLRAIREEMDKMEGLKDSVIRKELKEITQVWKPFDEKNVPENYKKYRYSGKELYADAISMLFNDPERLKVTAPHFYKYFFQYLDAKPVFKENFFAIQDLLDKGEEAVLTEREKDIREMFKKGEDLYKEKLIEKGMKKREYIFRLKHELIDTNQRVIDKIRTLQKQGKIIPDDQNPIYFLEANNYIGGKIKAYLQKNIQPIVNDLNKNNITWEDFGEVLFLERIINERGAVTNPLTILRRQEANAEGDTIDSMFQDFIDKNADKLPEELKTTSATELLDLLEKKGTTEQLKMIKQVLGNYVDENGSSLYDEMMSRLPKGIANPLGLDATSAQKQLDYLKRNLGNKYFVLEKNLIKYRQAIKSVLPQAMEAGIYKEELFKEMLANPAYSTFQVLDYLDTYIPASVKHQVGTLKDVANPADSTIQKTISTIRAIERNTTKKVLINFLKDNFPKDIKDAKTIWTGKAHVPVESRDPEWKMITLMEEGRYKGYYVDPYIAETVATGSIGQVGAVIQVFKLLNSKLYRPLFITYNTGFQTFNFARDFMRFYKNTPNLSLLRAIKRYGQSLAPSYRRAFDKADALINEMEEKKILSMTYNNLMEGMTKEDKQIELILRKVGLNEPKAKNNPIIRFPLKLFDVISRFGDLVETIPKVAGYKELNGKMPPNELASFIRTSVGSPDFLRGGAGKAYYNELFLFSNAIKEGMRSDYHVMYRNPKTRGGYWWKTAWTTLLPKIIMYGALLGWFGNKIKKMMEDVSEYDKTNYTIVPLGTDVNGKTVYMRLPQDETGRLQGGLLWKALQIGRNDRPIMKDLSDLLSYAGGQIPSISPSIESLFATGQFLAGQNPYDFFYGGNIIPDEEFKAGGWYALKPFLIWQFNNMGGGTFMKFSYTTQAPSTKTWLQKTLELPVVSNILGRWIKVSDSGQKEKNRAIIEKISQEESRQRLDERQIINEAVKEYKSGKQDPTRRAEIEKKLYHEIVGEPPYSGERKTKVTNTLKKFRIAVIKGEADANINSVISAVTNDQKVALLNEIKKQQSKEEYRNLLILLKKEKIISDTVLKQVR